jgi:hypothetical protein
MGLFADRLDEVKQQNAERIAQILARQTDIEVTERLAVALRANGVSATAYLWSMVSGDGLGSVQTHVGITVHDGEVKVAQAFQVMGVERCRVRSNFYQLTLQEGRQIEMIITETKRPAVAA